MSPADLPAVNATLNAVATAFLLTGFAMIKSGRQKAHIVCMVCALVTSAAFLTGYLYYHAALPRIYPDPAMKHGVPFTHEGLPAVIYKLILWTHVPLAMVCLPLVILTVVPALRRRFDRHKRLARWTLPIWLYVSVTGVLVYFMLYRWFRSEFLG